MNNETVVKELYNACTIKGYQEYTEKERMDLFLKLYKTEFEHLFTDECEFISEVLTKNQIKSYEELYNYLKPKCLYSMNMLSDAGNGYK